MTKEANETAIRIARQSQMERAIEYHSMMGTKPTTRDLVMTAEIFSKYIMNGWTSEREGVMTLEGMLNKLDETLQKEYSTYNQ